MFKKGRLVHYKSNRAHQGLTSVKKINPHSLFLFESGPGAFKKENVKVATVFNSKETRYINWELNLLHEKLKRKKVFVINTTFYRNNVSAYIFSNPSRCG